MLTSRYSLRCNDNNLLDSGSGGANRNCIAAKLNMSASSVIDSLARDPAKRQTDADQSRNSYIPKRALTGFRSIALPM